jgi:hypothetical protein
MGAELGQATVQGLRRMSITVDLNLRNSDHSCQLSFLSLIGFGINRDTNYHLISVHNRDTSYHLGCSLFVSVLTMRALSFYCPSPRSLGKERSRIAESVGEDETDFRGSLQTSRDKVLG